MTMQLPGDYAVILNDIKTRIQNSRVRAAMAANREMLRLYYSIGMDLSQRLQVGTYGVGVVDQLSRDLRQAFPDATGFGSRNLRYMRQFAESYPLADATPEELQRGVAISEGSTPVPEDLPDLPWRHVILLMSKVNDRATRAWYAQAAKRIDSPQTEWDILHGLILAYAEGEGEAPQARAYLAKHAEINPHRIVDLRQVYAAEIGDRDREKTAKAMLFDLKGR